MPQEDENSTEKTHRFNQFIFGNRNPKKWSYALSAYVLLGDRFKNRLISNAKLMKTLLRCCSRTADNYAIVMSFVDYLFDVFSNEMAAIGMTKQAWLDFIKNEWVPALKEIHISNIQRR